MNIMKNIRVSWRVGKSRAAMRDFAATRLATKDKSGECDDTRRTCEMCDVLQR